MNILGKVTSELPEQRGVDVTHAITAPVDWLLAGTVLLVELPRLLACAACNGGGCDVCERRGAGELRGRGEPPEVVRLELSESVPTGGQIVRLPAHGALGVHEGDSRGCLLLRIEAGEVAKGVTRQEREATQSPRLELGSRLLLAALAVVLLGLVLAIIFNH